MKLSLIIPCYNEQDSLPLFYEEVTRVMNTLSCDYELLFVNDGSTNATLSILQDLSARDSHAIHLAFSRTFGKKAAMYAEFCNAKTFGRIIPTVLKFLKKQNRTRKIESCFAL